MIMPGPIGVAVARRVGVADAIQARAWVTHDAQDARPIRLQHVDDCDPDASAKDLRPAMPSPWDNGPGAVSAAAPEIQICASQVLISTKPITAQSGGSVRARCEGLRSGPEPFGAHY
jgi:hypothetical protein